MDQISDRLDDGKWVWSQTDKQTDYQSKKKEYKKHKALICETTK